MNSPAEAFADVPIRFKLVNALPAAFLVSLVGALVLSGAPVDRPDFDTLLNKAREFGWVGAAASVVSIAIGALMLEPFELASVRLLEGYWSTTGILGRFGDFGHWLQERRRDRLNFLLKASPRGTGHFISAQRQRLALPSEQPLLPTALGNRLRAFEETAGSVYDLKAIDVWPRLYYILPEQVLSYVNMHRNQLDTACRLSLTFAASSISAVVLLLRFPPWWWLPLVLAAASMMAYRAALAAADNYCVAVTAAIDVYRLRLLQEMRIDMPTNTEQERSINDTLRRLWQNDKAASVAYAPSDTDVTILIKDLQRFITEKRAGL